jgi:hypothetical protein
MQEGPRQGTLLRSHGPDRNRTCDLLLAKQLLSQLSYEPPAPEGATSRLWNSFALVDKRKIAGAREIGRELTN